MLSLTDYETRHAQLRDELARAEEALGAASLAEATGSAEKGQVEDAQARVSAAKDKLKRLELALAEARKVEDAKGAEAQAQAYRDLRKSIATCLDRRQKAAEEVVKASDRLKEAVATIEEETAAAIDLMVAHSRRANCQVDFRQVRDRMRFQGAIGGRIATQLRAHGVAKTHFDASLMGVPDPAAFARSTAEFLEQKLDRWAPEGEAAR